jgi:hypothetical protein
MSDVSGEKHYTPQQVAELYGVSPDTIWRWFANHPLVLIVESEETMTKRGRRTMRIPESAARTFHQSHRAKKSSKFHT